LSIINKPFVNYKLNTIPYHIQYLLQLLL